MTSRRRQSGFTLIELLAASALAAMLVLVLFQVIGSLGRTRAALAGEQRRDARSAVHEPWKSDLLDLLRRDLANATERRFEPGRLGLVGHGSLDRRTLAATHDPAAVVYEVQRRGAQRCLVRRQADADGGTSAEVLCFDVTGFDVQPFTRRTGRDGIYAPRPAREAPIRVRIDGARGALLDEVIVVP